MTGNPREEFRAMYRSFGDLRDCRIDAIDAEVGRLHDLLFDDHAWIIRYFVVDTGSWLAGRKVLISPVAIWRATWESRQVRIILTRDQIKDAPTLDVYPRASRQEERRLVDYYAWPAYWRASPTASGAGIPRHKQRVNTDETRKAKSGERKDDPRLRSMLEVAGFRISTLHDPIGGIEGLLYDDTNWGICYFIADTHSWLPVRRVLLSTEWVENVDWQRGQVQVDIEKDKIANAPEYDPSTPIDREYEARLHEACDRPAHRHKAQAHLAR